MKIKSLFLSIICIAAFVFEANSQQAEASKIKLATEADSVSYAIGVIIGLQNLQIFEQFPGAENLHPEIVAKAFLQVMEGKDDVLNGDGNMANEILGVYLEQFSSVESKQNLEEGRAFLEQNRSKAGVHETESGLQYKILREGNGSKPSETDVVKVHYHGTFINGEVFDSSVERGEPIEFPVSRVIPGWTEGLQLMPVGSKWTLYIPGPLAYGEQGAGGRIGPNATLIFEVELLEIIRSELGE